MNINILNTILSKVDDETKNLLIQAYRFGVDDVIEVLEATPFGIGGKPPKETPLLSVKTDRGTYVIGALTLKKELNDGESVLFALNDKGKEIKSFVHCLNDGTINVGGDDDNAVLYSKLEEKFNELKADHNALVQLFNSHIHITTATVAATPTPGVIAPTTTQAQNSTVDISPAKSNKVKLVKN